MSSQVDSAERSANTFRLVVDDNVSDHIILTSLPPFESATAIIDGQTECVFLHSPMKQAILDTPGFPKSVPTPLSPKPYAIKEIPSKGLGMIATRDIKYGELITAERALIISYRGAHPAMIQPGATEAQIHKATRSGMERFLQLAIERFDSIPERKKFGAAFRSLHNSHRHETDTPLAGIFRDNCYHVEIPFNQNQTYSAVFNDLSRLNHSCSPNTFRSWETASLSMQLYAVRDIRKDEEITTLYVHPLQSLAERRSRLARYGFVCECAACTNPDSQLHRAYISHVEERTSLIAKWAENPNDKPLSMTVEMLELIEQEGVEMTEHYAQILFQLMLLTFVLGRTEEAKTYFLKWKVWQGLQRSDERDKNMLQACVDVLRVSRAAPPHPLCGR